MCPPLASKQCIHGAGANGGDLQLISIERRPADGGPNMLRPAGGPTTDRADWLTYWLTCG